MELDVYLTPYTTINSKWIRHLDLNIKFKCKTLNCKTPIRKHGGKLLDIGHGNGFWAISPEEQATQHKQNETDGTTQTKKFLHNKGNN